MRAAPTAAPTSSTRPSWRLFGSLAGSLAGLRLCAALALCAAGAGDPGRAVAAGAQDEGAARKPAAPEDLEGRKLELRGMEDTLGASQAQRARIEAEAAALREDRARLTETLVDLARQIDERDRKIAEAEQRLDTLTGSEEAIRRSLASRRALIAEILAALQRMGRKPPPALLASPDDLLAALRASMTLGAVLPEMRAETEALAADLADLTQLRRSIAAEKETLSDERARLALDRERLAALIDARQSSLSAAQQALGAENARAAELARQAASLKDLISKMESEVAAAAKAAEAARQADEARKAAEAASPEAQTKLALAPFADPGRLAPATAFANLKGRLPMPAAGTPQRGFGAPDGFGGFEKGMLLATRPRAGVVSPTDGWAAYAGPYRGYGQVLIINAGQGYYVILAGMDRINVNVGQFLAAGEPVATMGDGAARTAAAIAIGAAQPILYIEFRKDGAAIDPSPWWARPELQKVRG
ncbi:murein hydrolase activator EnvC family protein [Methylocella sp.]|uniref:murein hydrolase activator EnvC family protein n=1 Tax=Methylocella sp. TaxID=1978226 RepID=UPI003784A6C9